ncbi:MAG: putative lipid II flippase FtsW [Verrucomicrobia bacterium]|nr:putative lipid II flippase FtsW [Verrucomicrobiota bacterium]
MRTAPILLVFCVAALAALGLVMITSASVGMESARYLKSQSVWFGLGLAMCCIVAIPTYEWLRPLGWPVYAVALILLACVFIPGLTHEIKGARRWIFIGGQSFQPSEFAKLALIIALAKYGEANHSRMGSFMHGALIPALIIGGILGLIFPEPDWGTTALLAAVSGVMLLVAGSRPAFFFPAMLAGTAAFIVAIMNNSVRSTRIMAWLHPELYKDDKGYQAYQAMIAIGSGGVTGIGLGEGRTKLGFMPEHHTDFIFSVVGEELGLTVSLFVLLAYITIVICGVVIAWNARDRFGMLLACGLSFLIGLQAFINIGVVTAVLPNKGLALPFMSYGGTSLLCMFVAVGLLLNVARHGRAPGERAGLPGRNLNPFSEVPA